ncbi:Organ specific protein [Corchorus olitorius]|uniref:Organ specific protein n=1 Tax=Corchorus olitorius TaxID=93759 RepID=A0A1R3G1M4_9ROSI|nr:Organ specific protein [Corchorus olitorius]
MKSSLASFISLIFLFANSTIAARKDPGEQWRAIMNDQPMPEAIKDLLHIDAPSSLSNEKTNCHDDLPADRSFEIKKEEIFVKDFEPGHGTDSIGLKSFTKDFEPRPSASAYADDVGLKSFAKDFEPRPSASAYTDDVGLKSFTKDFEPRPSASAYTDDAGLRSFVKDFKPRPSASVYTDDIDLKSIVKDFEPRPSASMYTD